MMVHGSHSTRAQQRIANAFRRAGALAPEHAKSLTQLGLDDNRFVRNFIDRQIIREVRSGEFYFDDDAYREFRHMLLRWVMVPVIISLALMIYGIVAGRH